MTDPLTRERVETIRKGCDGVTQGPLRTSIHRNGDGRAVDCTVGRLRKTRNGECFDAIASTYADYKVATYFARLDPATVRQLCDAFLALEDAEKKARDFAMHYPQNSDGRNTFLIFADWIAEQRGVRL